LSDNIEHQFNALIRSFRTATATGPRLERALHRIGMLVSARAKINAPIDTGVLRNSVSYRVELDKDGGSVSVGVSGVPYAAMQEFGGTIRPKRARALTIPVAPWAKNRRARDFKLVLIRRRGQSDGGILVNPAMMKRGQKIPRNAIGFVLRRSVTIKGKFYLRRAVDDSTNKIVQILRELGE